MKHIKKSLFWLAIVSTIIIFSAVEGICGKLLIDDYVWDSKSQSFKMHLSTQAGNVSAVKLKGYRIKAGIKISQDTKAASYTVHGEKTVDTVTRAGTRTRAINRIGILNIPWDRDGGSLTGAVRARVTVMLLDRSGVVVDKASYTKTMRVW
jgi:hypothetical protein